MIVDIILLTSWLIGITIGMVVVLLALFSVITYLVLESQPKKIKFILTSENASAPQKGTSKSAGYDLKSIEKCVVQKRSHLAIKTGLKVELPTNTYGRIASRSGLSFKHGIEVGAGVIDEDYPNELMIILHNHSDTDFKVEVGDRIAQIIIQPVVVGTTLIQDINGVVNTIYSSQIRRLGGFGSTGIH
ncbi:dUTPase [Invertebrate iridovirus 25]|uniref:dUTP diphosphatase n=1 Tax=Invertebrate iridovirus 25 TaxID=1301280 RepID=W8W2U1_9VIRU|nr:dUTPase [Invertebrate iridovirus 25]CCV02129.1 dUTPase [Invertebrate iridovirus 25]